MIIPAAPFLTDRLLTELTAVFGPFERLLALRFPSSIMRELSQGLPLHSCNRAITPDLTYNTALPPLGKNDLLMLLCLISNTVLCKRPWYNWNRPPWFRSQAFRMVK